MFPSGRTQAHQRRSAGIPSPFGMHISFGVPVCSCSDAVPRRSQLEAIVRIAESLARMSLQPVASIAHVQEAVRLFNVSTLRAARAGLVEGMMTEDLQCEVTRAEESILKRIPIGNRVSTRQLITELTARLVRFRRMRFADELELTRCVVELFRDYCTASG